MENSRTFKDLLLDWEDYDVAQYYFCCVLGFVEYDDSFDNFRETKGVYNTNNKMSSLLFDIFERMVKAGILEKNDDNQLRFTHDRTLQEIAYNR